MSSEPATALSIPLDEGCGLVTAAPFDGSVDAGARGRVADYQVLAKVRLNAMVLITTAVGYRMAPGTANGWKPLLHVLFGTALTAAASGVLNQWMETDRDRLMPRTANRPLPAGRVSRIEALIVGLLLAVIGLSYLYITTNLLTFLLGLSTLLIYLAVYTPLKTRSTLNTIVGAIPGALPPLIGFAAATGHIDQSAMILFGIMFLWQMPHFLAIATMYREDYRAGGYKMLPVVDEDLSSTARQAVLYLGSLVFVSVTPSLFHLTGAVYTAVALLLGAGFMATGLQFAAHRTRKDARVLFFASIIYLPILLVTMVFDKA